MVPRFEDEAFGAVFAVEAGFFFLEDAEGFAGEVFAVDVFGIEDVAEFFFGEAVEFGVVGVELGTENGATAQLIGRIGVVLDVNARLLALYEEFYGFADAEGVIRCLGRSADLDRILVHKVLVRLGVARFVVHVPAEGLEEWIDEFQPDLSFVVLTGAVGISITLEPFDEIDDFPWSGHRYVACRG